MNYKTALDHVFKPESDMDLDTAMKIIDATDCHLTPAECYEIYRRSMAHIKHEKRKKVYRVLGWTWKWVFGPITWPVRKIGDAALQGLLTTFNVLVFCTSMYGLYWLITHIL